MFQPSFPVHVLYHDYLLFFFLFREARFQHGAAVVDDNIYVVGGKQDPMVANYSHITGEILKGNMCIFEVEIITDKATFQV